MSEIVDSVEWFAADLRALRLSADSPTLQKLQYDTSISKSVLSDAFSGRRLPSARTVDRVVQTCGADSAEWLERRDRLARTNPPRALAEDTTELATSAATTLVRRRTAVLLVGAAFILGIALSVGSSFFVTSSLIADAHAAGEEAARKELTESPANPRAQINVHNGVDAAMTACVNDAKVAASSPRTNDTLLEIIWSNKCYAGWARVTRYDERISGNSITVSIYPETAAQGPERQTAVEPNVQGAYTTLVVRPTPQTRLCAVGAITLDGESVDLGEPICI